MRIGDALRLVGGGSGGTFNGNCITADISPSFVVVSTNGTTLTVNWGDGTAAENFAMTGSNVDVDSYYGSVGTRTITFSGTGNVPMTHLYCYDNQLTSSEINAHLAQLVSNGLSNGTYRSNNQTTSAPPTGQGITDKATLQSRDWTVTTD